MTNHLDPSEVRKRANPAKEDKAVKEKVSPIFPFEVDYTTRDGEQLKGRFVFKVPSVGLQIEIARMKAIYLPTGAMADPNGQLLVEMISYLDVTLQEKPSWWLPHEFYDHGVISHVYGRCLNHEAKFLGKASKSRRDEESLPSEAANPETEQTDAASPVDGDVPASRKRREVLTADNA